MMIKVASLVEGKWSQVSFSSCIYILRHEIFQMLPSKSFLVYFLHSLNMDGMLCRLWHKQGLRNSWPLGYGKPFTTMQASLAYWWWWAELAQSTSIVSSNNQAPNTGVRPDYQFDHWSWEWVWLRLTKESTPWTHPIQSRPPNDELNKWFLF